MNKLYLLAILIGVATYIVLTSSIERSEGSPGHKTGSPGDGGANCTQCHTGTMRQASNWITSTIPEEGYTPGEKYTITASGNHDGASLFGFELTAEDGENIKVNNFEITDDKTQLIGAGSLTHVLPKSPENGSVEWSTEWTAPESGTGTVTFYAAVNAADGDASTTGDIIYTTSYEVHENRISSGLSDNSLGNVRIYPQPASEFIHVDISKNEPLKFQLYNQAGKLELSGNLEYKTEVINIQELQTGVYFIHIIQGSETHVRKILVHSK